MNMKTDLYTRIILTVIAIALVANVAKDIDFVSKAQAAEVVNLSATESRANLQERVPEDNIECYAKNNVQVYYNGRRIEGADSRSFEFLGDGYAKDYRRFYYCGMVIGDVYYSSSFHLLDKGYVGIGNNLFYKGKKMEGNFTSSFKVLCEK